MDKRGYATKLQVNSRLITSSLILMRSAEELMSPVMYDTLFAASSRLAPDCLHKRSMRSSETCFSLDSVRATRKLYQPDRLGQFQVRARYGDERTYTLASRFKTYSSASPFPHPSLPPRMSTCSSFGLTICSRVRGPWLM